MAGPDGRGPGDNNMRPTGTRPKSGTNNNRSYRPGGGGGAGSHQALVNLMREYQAVNESLAAAREQIEREGARLVTPASGQMEIPPVGNVRLQTRSTAGGARNSVNDEKVRELEMLRSRMMELEADLSSSRDVNTADDISLDCDSLTRGGDSSEEMERNLAMLTAQYEKTSQVQDEDSLHFSPGHMMVNNSLEIDKSTDGEVMPPAMSLLNNSSDTVKLARELRHKRDQLEELMKKNVLTTSVNESSNSGGRNKNNNRSWCEVTNPGQELYKLGDQVTRLKEELERLSQPVASGGDSQSLTGQISQLSVSVNQLYSGVWSLQRDVSQISERLAVLERAERRPSQVDPPHQPPPAWDSHQHFSPFPSSELWNSLQASPGFNNPLHLTEMFPPNFHISETDSGVSSGALNNQVSPGVRANNYYDNFRSFSRQNRLATSSQQSPQSSEPQPANNVNNARPRRKYKINREHNKDSGDQSNLRRRAEGANPVLAANTYTSPTTLPVTDSLTSNIYTQVGALIQQHDRAPELLARLLQDLTLLGQQESRNNMNIDLDTSSFTSEETRDTRETGNIRQASRHLQSRSKVAGKRFTPGQAAVSTGPCWSPVWSPVAGAVAVPKNQQKNLISRERNSRRMGGWRERERERERMPRNMQDREDQADQEGFINIQLELPEESHQEQESLQHGQSQSQSISDMAETEDLAEADQSQDMAHRDLWAHHHHEARDQEEEREQFLSPSQHTREIFQAEGVFPVRDSHSHLGLDRVPIRLPSTTANSASWVGMSQANAERIEARRLEENEAVASILEEVLASSSPELANIQESDTPPMP